MDMTRILHGLFGFVVITILGTFAYYLKWSGGAEEHRKQILKNLEHYEQVFTTPTAKLSFDYAAAKLDGFPFAKRVKLYQPSVTVQVGKEYYYIAANSIVFIPQGENRNRYQLEVSHDMSSSYKADNIEQENYRLYISGMPKIWLQTERGRSADDLIWNEFGTAFETRTLVIDVSYGDKSEKIGFTPIPTTAPIWSKIPSFTHYPIQLFVGMLREAMIYRK